jgi:endonuclease YncB( thermonuclease family)
VSSEVTTYRDLLNAKRKAQKAGLGIWRYRAVVTDSNASDQIETPPPQD